MLVLFSISIFTSFFILCSSFCTQTEQRQKIEAKKLRPPSYTDRILIHSLPDRQDRVTVQAYDFCDRLRVSDHRAVSMTIRLEVSA